MYVGMVTPCMGVWIETLSGILLTSDIICHTLYGCVDWNYHDAYIMSRKGSHTLYGCVDWNGVSESQAYDDIRHTLYGCVDWNT